MSYALLDQRLRNGEVILLDGGTGSELEKRGVAMDSDAWCGPATLKNVDVLVDIHRDYINAGADIITANTFASSRLMLEPAGYADRFEEINRTAVDAALRARETSERDDLLVAGSLSHMCPMVADSHHPDLEREPSAQQMRDGFHELAFLLADAGCDMILLEMMYLPQRIPLAFEAALATGLPVWAGFSVRRDNGGNVVSFAPGQSIPFAELLPILDDVSVQAAGIMHASSDVTGDAITMLQDHYKGPITAYPDSGYFRMPNWQFENVIAPEELARFARSWMENGAQVLGGCCGLSPAHIKALHQTICRL